MTARTSLFLTLILLLTPFGCGKEERTSPSATPEKDTSQAQPETDPVLLWLNESASAAKDIEDPYLKASAFLKIAQLQANTGYTEDAAITFSYAVNAAGEMPRSRMQADMLGNIARALASRGMFLEAVQTANRIKEELWTKADTMRAIVEMQAKAGMLKEAMKTAEGIEFPSPWVRVQALCAIAEAQTAAGNEEDAFTTFTTAAATAREVLHPVRKVRYFSAIAESQARAGNIEDSAQTFSEAVTLAKIVRNSSDRSHALYDIAKARGKTALAMAEAGKFPEAILMLKDVKFSAYHADASRAIVQAMIKKHKFAEAIETAKKISVEKAWYKASALRDIAQAQVIRFMLHTLHR